MKQMKVANSYKVMFRFYSGTPTKVYENNGHIELVPDVGEDPKQFDSLLEALAEVYDQLLWLRSIDDYPDRYDSDIDHVKDAIKNEKGKLKNQSKKNRYRIYNIVFDEEGTLTLNKDVEVKVLAKGLKNIPRSLKKLFAEKILCYSVELI